MTWAATPPTSPPGSVGNRETPRPRHSRAPITVPWGQKAAPVVRLRLDRPAAHRRIRPPCRAARRAKRGRLWCAPHAVVGGAVAGGRGTRARWHGSGAAAPQRGRCQDPSRGAAPDRCVWCDAIARGGEGGQRGASAPSGAWLVASASRIWNGDRVLQPESEVCGWHHKFGGPHPPCSSLWTAPVACGTGMGSRLDPCREFQRLRSRQCAVLQGWRSWPN